MDGEGGTDLAGLSFKYSTGTLAKNATCLVPHAIHTLAEPRSHVCCRIGGLSAAVDFYRAGGEPGECASAHPGFVE